MRLFLLAMLALLALPAHAETPPVTQADDDPYLWLEDIHGARAMAWVEAENARSLAILKSDPRYEVFHQQALKIVNAADRIPAPSLIGTTVYNFWQDPTNVRGLWRRTTAESYAQKEPAWETVIDVDKLAAAEKANWVFEGANCPPPIYRRCLVNLSDGGEDARTVREFDLGTKSFVDGGFSLSRSKQTVDWLDDDTLIVSRDWGPGTMTASSYPFVVKVLKRGQTLDQATEVFRGKPEDVSDDPIVLREGDGRKLVLIVRATDFFHSEIYQLTDGRPQRLWLPSKVDLQGLIDGRLVFTALEDWRGFKAGDLLAFRPEELKTQTSDAAPADHLIFAPGPRQSVEQVAATAHRVVAAIYDNVRGGLFTFTPAPSGGWRSEPLPVAQNSSVRLVAATKASDAVYYAVENFLAPTHLWRADAAGGDRPRTSRTWPRASTRRERRSTSTKPSRPTGPGSPTSSCIPRR
jgi:prolyl oligopeptidase